MKVWIGEQIRRFSYYLWNVANSLQHGSTYDDSHVIQFYGDGVTQAQARESAWEEGYRVVIFHPDWPDTPTARLERA